MQQHYVLKKKKKTTNVHTLIQKYFIAEFPSWLDG